MLVCLFCHPQPGSQKKVPQKSTHFYKLDMEPLEGQSGIAEVGAGEGLARESPVEDFLILKQSTFIAIAKVAVIRIWPR